MIFTEATELVVGMAAADVVARIIFSLMATNKRIASVAVYFFLAAEYGIFIILVPFTLTSFIV